MAREGEQKARPSSLFLYPPFPFALQPGRSRESFIPSSFVRVSLSVPESQARRDLSDRVPRQYRPDDSTRFRPFAREDSRERAKDGRPSTRKSDGRRFKCSMVRALRGDDSARQNPTGGSLLRRVLAIRRSRRRGRVIAFGDKLLGIRGGAIGN